MEIQAEIRKFFGGGRSGLSGSKALGLEIFGSQGISQIRLPKAVAAEEGMRWAAVMGSATLLAPVTAMPTTTATMGLYNDSDDQQLVIDEVGYHLGSGTPTAGSALVVCNAGGIQTRPTMSTGSNGGYAGSQIGNLGTGKVGGGPAIFATALTLLATGDGNPAWHIVAANPQALAAATFPAHVGRGKIDGGIIIPPRGVLGMAILSGTGTTPLFGFQVIFQVEAAR